MQVFKVVLDNYQIYAIFLYLFIFFSNLSQYYADYRCTESFFISISLDACFFIVEFYSNSKVVHF